jgi:hypothetical protein
MTHIIARLPDIDELKQRLFDPVWVDYYSKYTSFSGSVESIEYILDFFNYNGNNA